MVTPAFIQEVMKKIVTKLTDKRIGFGDDRVRPLSYYCKYGCEIRCNCRRVPLGEFADRVWKHAERLKNIIPPNVDVIEGQFDDHRIDTKERLGLAATELFNGSPEFEKKLESLANYSDRYETWVEDMRKGKPPQELPGELMDGLKRWAINHVPPDCLQRVGLENIQAQLLETLKKRIDDYRFDQDLLFWMIPELAKAPEILIRQYRTEPEMSDLGPFLMEKAELILRTLRERFGIDGLTADEAAGRALAIVNEADRTLYDARRGDIHRWALEVLTQQVIKPCLVFMCQPRMGMTYRWGINPETDRLELRKREAWVRKFLQMAQGGGHGPG